MHSSPIEAYESVNCYGKYVEQMTADECTQCKMEATDFTFTTASNLLSWAEDKINVMFCVKETRDIARAIEVLIENNATHRAFLELGLSNLVNVEKNNVANWEKVF
jgi:hydrogenase maturation factor